MGLKSNRYVALFARKGGQWTIVVDRIGPTDVAWIGWQEQFGAPAEIFPPQ